MWITLTSTHNPTYQLSDTSAHKANPTHYPLLKFGVEYVNNDNKFNYGLQGIDPRLQPSEVITRPQQQHHALRPSCPRWYVLFHSYHNFYSKSETFLYILSTDNVMTEDRLAHPITPEECRRLTHM